MAYKPMMNTQTAHSSTMCSIYTPMLLVLFQPCEEYTTQFSFEVITFSTSIFQFSDFLQLFLLRIPCSHWFLLRQIFYSCNIFSITLFQITTSLTALPPLQLPPLQFLNSTFRNFHSFFISILIVLFLVLRCISFQYYIAVSEFGLLEQEFEHTSFPGTVWMQFPSFPPFLQLLLVVIQSQNLTQVFLLYIYIIFFDSANGGPCGRSPSHQAASF